MPPLVQTSTRWPRYFYFSAFDEPWKLATLEANETVEAYFGLFTQEGVLKELISAEFANATASVDGSDAATITAVGADSSASASASAGAATTVNAASSTLADDDASSSEEDSTTQGDATQDGEATSDVDASSDEETASGNGEDDSTTQTQTATTSPSHKDCAM